MSIPLWTGLDSPAILRRPQTSSPLERMEAAPQFLEYPDKLVTLGCSKVGQSSLGSEILGDNGTLAIDSISQLARIQLYQNDGTSRSIAGSYEKNVLMSGEARDFLRYITCSGETREEYAYASRLSLDVCRVMAEIRRLAGIRFPGYEEGGLPT